MIFAYQGLARNQYNDLQIFHARSVLHWHLCYVEITEVIELACATMSIFLSFFFLLYILILPFLKDHLDQDRPYDFECANLFPPIRTISIKVLRHEIMFTLYLEDQETRGCHGDGVVPSWCSWLYNLPQTLSHYCFVILHESLLL